jgi:DmsE family decaheme c-type cytochrome
MHSSKTHPQFALSIATVMLLALLATALPSFAGDSPAKPAAPAAAAEAAQYVGADTCKACHEDLYNQMQRTPHFKMKFLPEHKGEGVDCEACHGPGSAHVEGGGDVSKIISFKTLTAQQASARCMSCHTYGNERANFTRSAHQTNDVGCTDCHSPHQAKDKRMLLVKAQPELCFTCHTEMQAEFSKPFRHRVKQGLLDCTDCHNQHGGYVNKQLRSTIGQDQVCFKCHTEKQGPFVFEHEPVKTEGCLICHVPHGSTNPRLLRTSQVNLLCLQCHTLTPNVASQNPVGPGHNQNQRYQACTICHAWPHGSNTSEVFFKP